MFKLDSQFIKSIPNTLTLIRILIIPIFVLLMIDPSTLMLRIATILFIVGMLTDLFDGMIARRFGAETNFGKLLDPLADKILVMTALVMMVSLKSDQFGRPWVPGWMVVIILAREIWVTGLRGVAASHGVVVAASDFGKLKSFLQMVGILLLLLNDMAIRIGDKVYHAQYLGLIILFLSIGFSIFSGTMYTFQVLSMMKEEK